jgi:hypothetical protein
MIPGSEVKSGFGTLGLFSLLALGLDFVPADITAALMSWCVVWQWHDPLLARAS